MGEPSTLNLKDFPLYLFEATSSCTIDDFKTRDIPSYSLPYCPWMDYNKTELVWLIVQSAKLKSPESFLKCSQIHFLNREESYLVELKYQTEKGGDKILEVLAQDKHFEISVGYVRGSRSRFEIVDTSFPTIPKLSLEQQKLYELSKDILLGQTDKYREVLMST